MSKSINKIVVLKCPVLFARPHAHLNKYDKNGKEYVRVIIAILTEEQKQQLLDLGLTEEINNLHKKKYESRFYTVDTASDGVVKALNDLGYDGLYAMKIQNKYKNEHIANLAAIPIVGRDGKTDFTDAIGNGSICNVHIRLKQFRDPETHKLGDVTPKLAGLQVVDHIPYNPEATTEAFEVLEEVEVDEPVNIPNAEDF